MYLLISGLWVNTAHIVSIEQPSDGKSMLVSLSNGDRLRVKADDAKELVDAVVLDNSSAIRKFSLDSQNALSVEDLKPVNRDAAPLDDEAKRSIGQTPEKPTRKRK